LNFLASNLTNSFNQFLICQTSNLKKEKKNGSGPISQNSIISQRSSSFESNFDDLAQFNIVPSSSYFLFNKSNHQHSSPPLIKPLPQKKRPSLLIMMPDFRFTEIVNYYYSVLLKRGHPSCKVTFLHCRKDGLIRGGTTVYRVDNTVPSLGFGSTFLSGNSYVGL
jgi:hypothetical protein